jgi:hypothetical protein
MLTPVAVWGWLYDSLSRGSFLLDVDRNVLVLELYMENRQDYEWILLILRENLWFEERKLHLGRSIHSKDAKGRVMIFLKKFDVEKQTLKGQSVIYVDFRDKVESLLKSCVGIMQNEKPMASATRATIILYHEHLPT